MYIFDFDRVHPLVFILLYWIYLLPSTQQTIGYNGFITTCFDSHESSSGYVQNFSVLAVLLLTVSCSGGCWSMWSGGWPYTDRNENLKNIYQQMLLGKPFNISVSRKFHIRHTFRFTRFCCWSFKFEVLVVTWHGIIFIKSFQDIWFKFLFISV
jgi:hypothetical protein